MLKGRALMWVEWWVWGAAAIALAVGEVLLPSFVLLGFRHRGGVVALVLLVGGPLAVWLGGSLPVLLLVFAVVSLMAWLALRRWLGVYRRAGEDLRSRHQRRLRSPSAKSGTGLVARPVGRACHARIARAAAAGSGAARSGGRPRCGRRPPRWPAPVSRSRVSDPPAAAAGPDTRRDDQLARGLGQGADQRRLVRGGDDAVGPGLEGACGAFGHDIGDRRPVADQAASDRPGRARSAPSRRGFSGPTPAPSHRGAHHMRVAVHGQEIEIELRQPRTAASTVAPMSKSFMSRKMRLPWSCLSSLASARPPPVSMPRPIL
jgi:hypothetical protein